MRHQGQMSAVGGAETSQPLRGAIWVKRILLGCFSTIVSIDQRSQSLFFDLVQHRLIGKMESTFTVINVNAENQPFHPFQHHGSTVLNLHCGPARFKAAGAIFDKARLPFCRKPLFRHPAEKPKKLASVADAEGKGIRATVKVLKHLFQARVEKNGCSPPFSRLRNICIRKTTDRGEPSELFKTDHTRKQVLHTDIPGLKTGCIKG